jgi:2-succinyl-6-hydroxy-2,4-cyclohexadiene-1-carboxylate synthase
VLESASPGLATEAERAERVRSDEALASRIEQIGTEAFLDEWEALPMFAGERARPARVAHRASGLASALRVLGTGAQPSQWDGLAEVGPSLLITGERDAKFTAIAAKMETMMPRALRRTIPGAGHAPHREAPEATARALATFL